VDIVIVREAIHCSVRTNNAGVVLLWTRRGSVVHDSTLFGRSVRSCLGNVPRRE